MQIEVILLANSFFLIVVLVLLGIILFSGKEVKQKKSKTKEDLKKIKDQITSNS